MSDLSIKYNSQTVGSLDDSGVAILKTADKRCLSDIEIEYTKSGGGENIDFISTLKVINNSSSEVVIREATHPAIVESGLVKQSVEAPAGTSIYGAIYGSGSNMFYFQIYTATTVTVNVGTATYNERDGYYTWNVAFPETGVASYEITIAAE